MKKLFGILSILTLFQWQMKAVGTEPTATDIVMTTNTLGVSAETSISQLDEPENAVAELSQIIPARLHAISPTLLLPGLRTRSAQTTAVQIPLRPDNPELYELVKLVQSGMSEQIILSQIRGTSVASRPTATDLLFLKENNIPEVIITALMEANVSTAEGSEVTFNGLVYRRFFRDRSGALVFVNDKFVWRDASRDNRSFELFMNGVSRIELYNRVSENDRFCYRIRFEFTKGDDYAFEDVQKDTGGNENLMRLVEYLKHHFQNVSIVNKDKT